MLSFFKKYRFVITLSLILAFGGILWLLYSNRQKAKQPPFLDIWVQFGNAYYTLVDPSDESIGYYQIDPVITEEMIGPSVGYAVDNKGNNSCRFFRYTFPQQVDQQALYLASCDDSSQYRFAVFVDFVPGKQLPTAKDYFGIYGIHGADDILSLSCDEQLINDPVTIDKFYHALYGAAPFKPDYSQYIDDKDVSHITIQTDHFFTRLVYDRYENVLVWGDTHFQLQQAADQ